MAHQGDALQSDFYADYALILRFVVPRPAHDIC